MESLYLCTWLIFCLKVDSQYKALRVRGDITLTSLSVLCLFSSRDLVRGVCVCVCVCACVCACVAYVIHHLWVWQPGI